MRCFSYWFVLISAVCMLMGSRCMRGPVFDRNTYNRLSNECALAVTANQLEEAESRCNVAIRYHPCGFEALNNLGLVKIRYKQESQAEEFFKKALNCHSPFAQARNNLGSLYFSQRNYTRARNLFNSCLDIDPSLRDCNYNLARTLVELREWQAARKQILQMFAFPQNKSWPPAHFLLGYVEFSRKDYKRAIVHFMQAVRLNPRYTDAHLNLCKAAYQISRYDLACSFCKHVLTLEPHHVEGNQQMKEIQRILSQHNQRCL